MLGVLPQGMGKGCLGVLPLGMGNCMLGVIQGQGELRYGRGMWEKMQLCIVHVQFTGTNISRGTLALVKMFMVWKRGKEFEK
jgi:hypothetical protein